MMKLLKMCHVCFLLKIITRLVGNIKNFHKIKIKILKLLDYWKNILVMKITISQLILLYIYNVWIILK